MWYPGQWERQFRDKGTVDNSRGLKKLQINKKTETHYWIPVFIVWLRKSLTGYGLFYQAALSGNCAFLIASALDSPLSLCFWTTRSIADFDSFIWSFLTDLLFLFLFLQWFIFRKESFQGLRWSSLWLQMTLLEW